MAEQFLIPTPGDTIAGKYLILSELGRGSYGVVFHARHVDVGREVALKTLLPQAFLQSDVVERFQREASMISCLQHPHVVTLYDYGESEGVLYMVMELLQGRDLAQVIKQEAPLPPKRAVKLITQVLLALQAAHAEGIVHRDLKPENIVLCQVEDDPDFVKVLDFGIAKMTSGDEAKDALKTLTVQGYVLGTPYYMAPEVITGEQVTNQADLYAVGLLLYELLCGVHPFEAPNPSAVLVKHLSDPIPPLLDPEQERSYLGYAVRRALAKEPVDRTTSATDFIQILEEERLPDPVAGAGRTLLWGGALFFCAALVLCVLAFYLLLTHEDKAAGVSTALPSEQMVPARDSPKAAPKPREPWVWGEDAAPPETKPEEATAPPEEEAPDKKPAQAQAPIQTPRDNPKTPPAKGKAPPRNKKVQVNFASEPGGARVSVNGAVVCTAPCARAFAGDQNLKVVFSKIGYRAATRNVALQSSPKRVSAKLQPGRIKLVP